MSRRKDTTLATPAILDAMRSSIRILTLGMVGLALLYLGSGITIVGPNEVGVIFRFGRLIPFPHAPGLMLAFPAPIDEVVKVPVKSLQEVPLELWASQGNDAATSLNPVSQPYTLTGDANIVQAKFVVRYQISDPIDYLVVAKDLDALRDAILYESACQVLSAMPVEDALTARKNYIGQEAMRLAQNKINALHLGLQLLAFETREINPPKPVLGAFQAVVSAKVQAKTLIEEANAYAATTLPDAKAQAYRIRQEADSFAKKLVAVAQGESNSFVAMVMQDRANTLLVRARLYNEMVETVMPKVRVATVVPGGKGRTNIFLEPQKGMPASSGTSGEIR